MLSCDSLAITAKLSIYGSNMMAKNSDRPLGEAQPLIWFAPENHKYGEQLSCTHITIPQVEHTFGIVGSKPYWIWGFEMGVNEKGVAIANEAQGSRDEIKEQETGLLGMDLLRLGLERGSTAREALKVITTLLEQYGQRGNANPLFERRYENSYLIIDPEEVWQLETAGRRWVAKQIHTYTAISNCYSIEEEFDFGSNDLEDHARTEGWLLPNEPFNFAKAYTLPAVRQTYSIPRWRRAKKMLEQYNLQDFPKIKQIMRDHFEGELIEPRFGASYGNFVTICMHAMTWDASQTAASMLVRYRKSLGPIIRHALSTPCCSVYIPVYCVGKLPSSMECGGEFFEEKSLWWLLERLSSIASVDHDRFVPAIRQAADKLEAEIEREAQLAEDKAIILMKQGEAEQAKIILQQLTEQSAKHVEYFAIQEYEKIRKQLEKSGGIFGTRKAFLEDYCRRVQMNLL